MGNCVLEAEDTRSDCILVGVVVPLFPCCGKSVMGWLASILLLSGALLVGYKRELGFYLQFFGNMIWCIIGCLTGMYDLAFVEGCFCAVNLWAVFMWQTWDTDDE